MKVEQRYEERILNRYLLEMELTEDEDIRLFLHKNELSFLITTLLQEGSKFLMQRILILCTYIAERRTYCNFCRSLINTYILTVNENIKWYLIVKILVVSEMILKNQL